MLRKFLSLLLSFFIVTFSLQAEGSLKMAVTGLPGLEELERNFGEFQDALNEATGLKIKFYPLSSRTIIVQSLKLGNVDLVLFGPAEYVITTSKTNVHLIAALTRDDYYSGIVTLANSNLNSLEDLRGKTIGVGDFGSTAYNLSPLQMIKDVGIDPLKDIKTIILAKHVGWESLKKGQIDALGLKYAQYENFLKKESRFQAKDFKVIAKGPQLPNDLLIAGGHVPRQTVESIRQAISENSDALIASILAGVDNDKYANMQFLTNLKDSDYDSVREMFKTIGYPEFSVRAK